MRGHQHTTGARMHIHSNGIERPILFGKILRYHLTALRVVDIPRQTDISGFPIHCFIDDMKFISACCNDVAGCKNTGFVVFAHFPHTRRDLSIIPHTHHKDIAIFCQHHLSRINTFHYGLVLSILTITTLCWSGLEHYLTLLVEVRQIHFAQTLTIDIAFLIIISVADAHIKHPIAHHHIHGIGSHFHLLFHLQIEGIYFRHLTRVVRHINMPSIGCNALGLTRSYSANKLVTFSVYHLHGIRAPQTYIEF